jgi:hypothetical protein
MLVPPTTSQQGIVYERILKRNTLNYELLRYELHRVWVVDVLLRKGFRHPYGGRSFTWTRTAGRSSQSICMTRAAPLLIDWQESPPISYYEVPMFGSTLESLYDVKGDRYFVDGLDNNEPLYDFSARLSPCDFTPAGTVQRGQLSSIG